MSALMEARVPAANIMMQMINGKCLSRCVSLAAELGIADLLVGGPKSAAALAQATGTTSESLYRVLRLLAAVDVFEELPNRHFANTPLSSILISGAKHSLRQYARWFGRGLHWHMYTGLETTVRTGLPWAANEYPGKTPFEVLAQHPADQSVFNLAMAELSGADGPVIADTYDFRRFRRIVDVGGGDGTLAGFIAAKAPQAHVTVLDLPHVSESTRERMSKKVLLGQIEFRGGSFLDEVPGPADLCVLKHILHDWDDETAVRVLTNCRGALTDGGRILVCEMLVEPGPQYLAALALDVEMLVGAGGRERSEAEFSDLFMAAGLRLERVIHTPTALRLLEAVQAS